MALALAWAAGLFDGEGSTTVFNCRPKKSNGSYYHYRYFKIMISQTDPFPLTRFCKAVNVSGKIWGPCPNGRHKPYWKFTMQGPLARKVMKKLKPFLSKPKLLQLRKVEMALKRTGHAS